MREVVCINSPALMEYVTILLLFLFGGRLLSRRKIGRTWGLHEYRRVLRGQCVLFSYRTAINEILAFRLLALHNRLSCSWYLDRIPFLEPSPTRTGSAAFILNDLCSSISSLRPLCASLRPLCPCPGSLVPTPGYLDSLAYPDTPSLAPS